MSELAARQAAAFGCRDTGIVYEFVPVVRITSTCSAPFKELNDDLESRIASIDPFGRRGR